jgi:hypothetical protein
MSPKTSWILENEICPRLGAAVPRSVLCVGAEDAQELIQDAIVMSAKMLVRLEMQGKLGKVKASNIAYYTLQHMKSGRRSCGSSSVCVLGSATQLQGSSRLHSLHEVVSESEVGDEIFELHDVISNDHEDPGTIAARKMDWDILWAKLTKVERLLIECLVSGMGIREMLRRLKVSKNKLQELQRKIGQEILQFMGLDILREVMKLPRWRDNLMAQRELVLCRHERV